MPPSDAINSADSICVVQLTDSHLFADPQQRLLGLDTLASLNAVIDQVLDECPQIDLVLATGDITQDGSAAAYERFIDAVARIPQPCHWIPGNHDDAVLMAELGEERGLNRDWVDIGQWRIVLLDSSVSGSVAGYLDQQQLARLDQALSSAGQRHVLVCLHHHPVPIGSDWMEPIGLGNADQLLARLDAEPQVRGVLWGHIHQQLEQRRGTMRLLASPSTCVQFAVASSDFATDNQPPGYRWLRLYDDGRIDTAVSRLPPGSFLPQAGASGY
ncbi:3',5'-cyclic-AMP phosphodiesterase [Pseudomonas sp. MYb185]|uniref:3',5'-cyclic-AMP phosphodiesterase n=1 Tax=Pseudomonas sp. MYb185 TaxID=1848729 RepID=UPI000CFB832F|nr:3',5'-cyclic-AMP phosphodiesterase [Pseudomonas sp. MYb185]PRB84031.1 3',5'-cyclic-AMP phosphodiesterase [Pseudomonas sp. MYb185]